MQTFIPYPSFTASACVLDNRRLGKQRVECLQILKALHDPDYGWQNHPAVKMWRGCEGSLVLYARIVCAEWIARGYKDTCLGKVSQFSGPMGSLNWLTPEFHRSHQSNLKRKDPAHYGPLFPDVPDDLPYVWPRTN
jgi:Pyrimidine dimer DNA glycosylase